MRRIIIITCTCNGSPWFSWYTAKVWHAAAFSCNGSARGAASALMRISSNYYKLFEALKLIRIIYTVLMQNRSCFNKAGSQYDARLAYVALRTS